MSQEKLDFAVVRAGLPSRCKENDKDNETALFCSSVGCWYIYIYISQHIRIQVYSVQVHNVSFNFAVHLAVPGGLWIQIVTRE